MREQNETRRMQTRARTLRSFANSRPSPV
eukprot:COSAG03_NODE_24870_length_269_cov_0.870588_1_plen_28_part_10